MNLEQFVHAGHEMIDLVSDYMDNLHNTREPVPQVHPGYLRKLLSLDPPKMPESWDKVKSDIEPIVLTGITHWQHKRFLAYFPSGNSWPSLLAEMLSNAIGCECSAWEECPAGSELEAIVLDWVAKYIGLPSFYLSPISNPHSTGGGVLQHSASHAVLLSMLAAREAAIKKLRVKHPTCPKAVLLRHIVAYCSDQSHSCVSKAAIIAGVLMRDCPTDEFGTVRNETLRQMLEEDTKKGKMPFYFCAVLGSTGICGFDDLEELGPLIKEYDMWFHVDSAYAGSSFCCPELRYLLKGIEASDSFNCNANKWMLVNFDASMHWVKDRKRYCGLLTSFNEEVTKFSLIDFKHWGIGESRRFQALKLYCVIRAYGASGIRRYIRRHIYAAKLFERYVSRDKRFEVIGVTRVGLVCFRLKGTNELNTLYLKAINSSRLLHMVPTAFNDKFALRFAPTSEYIDETDVDYAWNVCRDYATAMIHAIEQTGQEGEEMNRLFECQEYFDKHFNIKEDESLNKMASRIISGLMNPIDGEEIDELVTSCSTIESILFEEQNRCKMFDPLVSKDA